MFVCICHAVTEQQVATAVDGGAESLDVVSEITGAGSSCGMCHDTIESVLDERCRQCPMLPARVA